MPGYGAKGQAAVDAMLAQGSRPGDIAVLDTDAAALKRAARRDLVTLSSSAADTGALREAGIQHAKAAIITVGADDTAVSPP